MCVWMLLDVGEDVFPLGILKLQKQWCTSGQLRMSRRAGVGVDGKARGGWLLPMKDASGGLPSQTLCIPRLAGPFSLESSPGGVWSAGGGWAESALNGGGGFCHTKSVRVKLSFSCLFHFSFGSKQECLRTRCHSFLGSPKYFVFICIQTISFKLFL